jgi:hypothetical protein
MVKQLTRSAVRIYGALSALGNGSENIMESLLPFFDPVLRRHSGEKFDPTQIASEVRETYNWNFNSDLVEAFVPYLERQSWIQADVPKNKDTTYTIRIEGDSALDASAQSVDAELRKIATEFKHFASSLSPLTSISLEVEEFEDILVEWLLYIEAFSEVSIDFRSVYRPDENGKLVHKLEVPRTTSLRDEEQFLCARFVQHVIEKDLRSAEMLARIASIGLLTEVVQDFVKPVGFVEKTSLVVYLDAPVAMELLGVSGSAAKENTAPIVEELIRIGASVRIFGQSVQEIQNSLQAVLRNPHPTGPTAQALLRREVLREYVVAVSQNPATFLEGLGVRPTYRALEQTPSEHQYFDEQRRRDLCGRLTYAENPHAREHDADVTTLVIRQRRGRSASDLFKSNVILITRNGLLAQIVRKVFREMEGVPENVIPPVVHRRALATAIWLRTGLGAQDLNIPKRMLLASCERVLAIRPNVVDAVKRLTVAMGDQAKAQQLDLLISQDRSAQALMDKTLGLTNVVTEQNFSLLWQEMIQPYLEEEREKAKAAVEAEKATTQKKLGLAQGKLQSLEQDKESLVSSLASERSAKIAEDREAIDGLCSDVARKLMIARNVRIGLGLIFGLICSVPLLLDTTLPVRTASFIVGWVLAFLTITGGQIMSVGISSGKAIQALRFASVQRRISAKLDQFRIGWSGREFEIEELEIKETPKKELGGLSERSQRTG